jgi:hypothetical protein
MHQAHTWGCGCTTAYNGGAATAADDDPRSPNLHRAREREHTKYTRSHHTSYAHIPSPHTHTHTQRARAHTHKCPARAPVECMRTKKLSPPAHAECTCGFPLVVQQTRPASFLQHRSTCCSLRPLGARYSRALAHLLWQNVLIHGSRRCLLPPTSTRKLRNHRTTTVTVMKQVRQRLVGQTF